MAVLSLSTCAPKHYHLDNNSEGEPVVKPGLYVFDKRMTMGDAKVLDTNTLYLQVFKKLESNATERANPGILEFHNDGYYKISSRRYYGKFDAVRIKQSVYYGGRFYLVGNQISTENFYPVQGGKTNYYVKNISSGSVNRDTVKLLVDGKERVYIKTTAQAIFN